MIHRRTLLLGVLALPPAACAARPAAAPPPPTTTPPPTTSRPPVDTAARFSTLERKYRTRLGVYAVATGSGATLAYRADERFVFCSTFKGLVAAAVLDGHPLSYLDTKVVITRSDVDSISPVTEHHIGSTMTIRQLCDAAARHSDGTAGNLLMRAIGGPATARTTRATPRRPARSPRGLPPTRPRHRTPPTTPDRCSRRG